MAALICLSKSILKVPFLEQEKLAKEGEDKVQEQIAMAKLYLYQAVDITLKGKESVIFVEGDEQRMMLMGLRP
jgi:hypothetical protein